ncbi:MAG: DNA polymerase II [archaeon]
MKGFIVYSTYRTINDRAYVNLFGRLENGESFATLNYFRPYFYIKETDLKKAQKIENFEFERTEMTNFEGEKVVKILLDIPKEVKTLRDDLLDEGIVCYEADILFPQRFLLDHDIKGALEIEGEHEQEDYVNRVYKEPKLKKTEYWPDLKILSFDIETNSKTKEINAISIAQDKVQETLVVSPKKLKHSINCADEEELLEKFIEKIRELDPDIITGWNVIDFDFAVINEALKKYEINFAIGRDNSPCKLRLESSFFKNSKLDVPGRMVLDGLAMVKASPLKVRDYKLDTVAEQVLGDKKLIQFKNKSKELDELFKKNTQKYIDYNLKDAQLVLDILDKSKILNFVIKRSTLTGLLLDRMSASIASLDSLYIRKANQRGLVVPSLIYAAKERQILGGYVRESEPGIYDNVLVLDFKSLYPSIIRTFNIDPASFVEDCKGKDLITAPNGACFKNEQGILSEILEELWKARDETKAQKDELARYAIKTLMASFFGAMATPNSRFFNMKIANAITHYGQYLIKMTAKQIEEKGYKVIYSDTDSCFVLPKTKDYNEALLVGKKLETDINEFYDKFIKKEYKRKSHLELEFEKCYVKFLMPKIRGGETGAKKRYAGLLKDDKIQITGLEAIRGDWTSVAQKFQKELLDLVFHDKPVEKYITKFVEDLKKGKYDKLLVYRKSIRKELEDYTRTTPPHVKAARKLEVLDGTTIEYVITSDGPEPLQNQKHEINYEHYIKKQLEPVADSILVFLTKNFEDIVKGTTQSTLGSF